MKKGEQIRQWVTMHPPTPGGRGYYKRVADRFNSTPESVRSIVKKMNVPNIVDGVQAKRSKKIMGKAVTQIELAGQVYDKKQVATMFKVSGKKKNFGFDIPKSDTNIITHTIIKPGDFKVGIINDVHFPYHSKENLELALEKFIEAGVNKIILNGDIVDFYSISRFSKTPNAKTLVDEIAMAKECFRQLRLNFPDVEIYYKCGNHENRLYRYLTERAVGLHGLEELTLPNVLRLDDFNIKFVDDHEFILIGDLTIMHGHELGTGGGMNIAHTMFRKYLGSMCFGHYHRTQDFYTTIATGQTLQAHSIGALCDLNPKWLPYNGWNAGFAIVEFEKSGEYLFNNYRIHNGKIVNVWPH